VSKKIYLLPGFALDPAIFDKLELPGELIYMSWLEPKQTPLQKPTEVSHIIKQVLEALNGKDFYVTLRTIQNINKKAGFI